MRELVGNKGTAKGVSCETAKGEEKESLLSSEGTKESSGGERRGSVDSRGRAGDGCGVSMCGACDQFKAKGGPSSEDGDSGSSSEGVVGFSEGVC